MGEDMDRELTERVRREYRDGPTLERGARERLLERLRGTPPPARPLLGLAPPGPRALRTLAALAAAALVVWWATAGLPGLARRAPRAGSSAGTKVELVRFQIAAAGADRVVLIGDFNGWDPQAAPMERASGTDTWAVTVAVPRGRHLYAFLVNGRRWLADPAAPLAPEDGFGVPNSVLIVGGLAAS